MPASGSIRTTKKAPCPICGDARCLIASSGKAVICLRVSEGCAKRKDGTDMVARNGLGWVHHLQNRKLSPQLAKLAGVKPNRSLTPTELKAIVRRHKADLSTQRLENAAKTLGVSTQSLLAYQMGYDVDTGCWSFPMYHWVPQKGKVLCGVRLRSPDGRRKLCISGSQNGLFVRDDYDPSPIPSTLTDDPNPYLLLTPEGPTDCCAAFDCGYVAVGRPSNSGGIDDVVAMLAGTPPQETIVIADHDQTKYLKDGSPFWPGIEGAILLLKATVNLHGTRRFCFPPEHAKDLRKWLKDGGVAGVLGSVINDSPIVTARWIEAAERRLATRKQTERKPCPT